MKDRPIAPGTLRACAALVLLVSMAASGCSTSSAASFRAEELAEGVWLFRPADGDETQTNSLVVERVDGLLVVEAQPTEAAGRELIKSIRTKSDRPIRYLVLSHPHAEAVGGAAAFPGETLVIGSEGSHQSLRDESFDFGAELRERSADPATWKAPARPSINIAVTASLQLPDEKNPVLLVTNGTAHSPGDMFVNLPQSDLVYIGGLLFADGVPYSRGGNVKRWLTSFNGLSLQKPATIVGLHGPAVDVDAIRAQRDALAWIRGQVEFGIMRGLPNEDIAGAIAESADLDTYFDPQGSREYLGMLTNQVLDEAMESRRKRGR